MRQTSTDRALHRPWLIAWICVHLAPLGLLLTGARPVDWLVCLGLYAGRMFFVTAGYHRWASHRSFEVGRLGGFLLAFAAQTSAQRGILWWAAHHRQHHRRSDEAEDVHSPLRGFWESHFLWVFRRENMVSRHDRVKDLARLPELRWLDRWHLVPPTMLAATLFAVGGGSMLLCGFFLSTALLYHGTYTINSLSHVIGTRRYVTHDSSRNNALLALITLGEGWHNNHHHYPSSCRQGFFWWEYDFTWYGLKALGWIGVVRRMRAPTATALRKNRVRDGIEDVGLYRVYLAKATAALQGARRRGGALKDGRRRALEDLAVRTRETAEEIARLSRTQGETG